ncbi:hypothetical protein K505DRAFT_88946 [Melanomma pulvis-pyrius CBS 109.77]|uniref:Uncharacterized protein n=1 Tax=Melanomma pulvis-pyrius CBS 109.77 TaxID=1314802 RepID=A0A6A6X0X5_9PLEO|nr:hypothetical protein K505DRAFT_88946 [Melanomma pulvis-pyrius CBS 109.77]
MRGPESSRYVNLTGHHPTPPLPGPPGLHCRTRACTYRCSPLPSTAQLHFAVPFRDPPHALHSVLHPLSPSPSAPFLSIPISPPPPAHSPSPFPSPSSKCHHIRRTHPAYLPPSCGGGDAEKARACDATTPCLSKFQHVAWGRVSPSGIGWAAG